MGKFRPVITAVIWTGIMFMLGIDCCDGMDMIVMMNMVFGRRQGLAVLSHMLRPHRAWHDERAQKQGKGQETEHDAGIAAWFNAIN